MRQEARRFSYRYDPRTWTRCAQFGLALGCLTPAAIAQVQTHEEPSASRFPDEPIPLKLEGFPQRPKPILELGAPFLGTGTLDPGFEMPGGAVWQPAFLVYGTYRSAIQTFDDGVGKRHEDSPIDTTHELGRAALSLGWPWDV